MAWDLLDVIAVVVILVNIQGIIAHGMAVQANNNET